jgi:monoamine oxidase
MAGARARVADGDVAASAVLTPPAERPPAEVSAARRLETSLTVPLARVSARRLFAGGDGHGYDPADRVRAGNQEAARELARRLGGNVRLRSPVTAIRHDSSAASVRCGGEELRAAAVIIAVPLPLLAALDLDPGLPPAIRSAAGRALFGDAAKLHVPLAHRPQAGRIASPSALWWCWTSRAPGERDAAPVLSAFAGGAEAVAGVGAAEGPDAWAAQALALRPDVEPAGSPFVTHWGADPWTRGSYISHGIGSTDADDAAWAEPWGRAVLAGEHTAGPAAGSMNGAVASGARAAKTVIELLRRRGA